MGLLSLLIAGLLVFQAQFQPKNIKKVDLSLLAFLRTKKIGLVIEEPLIEVPPKTALKSHQEHQLVRHVPFPWEKFIKLEEAHQNGTLSLKQLGEYYALLSRILNSEYLMIAYCELVPAAPSPATATRYQLPNAITCFGCGVSKPAESRAEPNRHSSSEDSVNESEPSPENRSMLENGILDMREMRFQSHQISETIRCLTDEQASSVHTLIIAYNLIDRPIDLSRLRNLQHIDASYNQLREIPETWVRQIGSQSSASINLQGNQVYAQFDERIIQENPTVRFTLPNHPFILAQVAGSDPEQIHVSTEYPSTIIERQLYLGAIEHLSSFTLRELRVETVINCARDEYVMEQVRRVESEPGNLTFHHLKLDDAVGQSLDLRSFAKLIHDQVREGKAVLVNCRQGVSRSASVVIAYMMLYQNLDLSTAIARVQEARPIIHPNEGFIRQLIQLELELRPETNLEQLNEEIELILGPA